jgi:O-methyltransferase involved in polyketide biosynthesis
MAKKNKIDINLGTVQETLLLPLWARAREAEKKTPVLLDLYAKNIIDRLGYDFTVIEQGIAEEHRLMWVIRALNFDKAVELFMERHDRAAVVNLGAGLDTGFQRLDNREVRWINIDLPDVVSLRQQLIPDSKSETTIAGSLFDFGWIGKVKQLVQGRSLMFMAAGVLCYFTAPEVELLFRKMAPTFSGAHFVFDAMSRLTVWGANRDIMKKSGMDSSALLKWHLNNSRSLKKWLPSIKIINDRSMFSGPGVGKGLKFQVWLGMKIAGMLRMYKLIQIRL